tara:strand:- start:2981 stop:4585 length:1605 start_codon:yes stop_codon:yes gene_type:complete
MKIALISTDMHVYTHGLRAISTYLKQHGHETIIISMPSMNNVGLVKDYKRLYSDEALKNMAALVQDCQLVGVCSIAANFEKAIQVVDTIKPLKIPTVWGGIFPTTYSEFCIKHCDIICVGEGEMAICELADRIEANENYFDVKNFWFKKDNQVIKNSMRPMIHELDDLYPDYDLETNFVLENNKEIVKLSDKHLEYWLFYQGTRGCFYSCKFCCNYQLDKMYNDRSRKIRKKSVPAMIKDIKEIRSKFSTIKYVWFNDDDMNVLTIDETKQFSELYKKEINLPFKIYMSPPTVNEEKLKYFLEAGLDQIELGIQTGSDRVNKELYGRPIFRANILKAAKILNKQKKRMSSPSYQIIANNPYENQQDVLDTISLLQKIPAPYKMQPFGLVFFPGTPLYDMAVKDGIVKKFEDSGYDLDFNDMSQHLGLGRKNFYLNCLINYMGGSTTRYRHGLLPKFILPFLLNTKIINFFDKNHNFLSVLNIAKSNLSKIKIVAYMSRKFFKVKGWIYGLVPIEIKKVIKIFLKKGVVYEVKER